MFKKLSFKQIYELYSYNWNEHSCPVHIYHPDCEGTEYRSLTYQTKHLIRYITENHSFLDGRYGSLSCKEASLSLRV